MVEPRGAGMVLITLRASEEVRAAAFEKSDAEIDAVACVIRRSSDIAFQHRRIIDIFLGCRPRSVCSRRW